MTSLTPHQDLELLEMEFEDGAESGLLAAAGVQVLMTSNDGARLGPGQERLLWSHPRLRILVIDGGGRQAALYELQTHRIALQEISTERLADVIRTACARPRTADLIETGSES